MCQKSMEVRVPSHGFSARAAMLLACLLTAPVAIAEDAPNLLTDPFSVALGTFILSSDTEVRVNGATRPGTPVDWENTFGDPGDQTRFRIDGHWRFGDSERHKLRFLWFNSSTSTSRTLERDVEWNGETYPLNAKVRADFSFDIYELAYEYALLHKDNYELSASIGLHMADLSMKLSAKAETSGGQLDEDISREASANAPLPVIGLRGLWALPNNFWIDASAQYFALSIDEFDGSLTDYKVVVLWQPKKWLGIGVGYNQFGVDVDIDKDRFNGQLDWTYSGPMISYSATF
jgi:hypothetical protein